MDYLSLFGTEIKVLFCKNPTVSGTLLDHVPDKLKPIVLTLREGEHVNTKILCNIASRMIKDLVPKIQLDVIHRMNKYISEGGMRKNYWFAHHYVTRMAPYEEELGFLTGGKKSNVLTAGLFCFVGQCLMYWNQFGFWDTAKERHPDLHIYGDNFLDIAFAFSVMYVYADYFLDGVHCTGMDKSQIMKTLMVLLHNPFSEDPPEGMKGLLEAYRKIIKISPESKPYLTRLFMVEVEGMKYQSDSNCTREQYFDIAERKGGMTGLAITAILGLSTRHVKSDDPSGVYGYQIGSILQLLDDMIDVYDDIEDGIHTIATHELEQNGNMDHLFVYTTVMVHSIHDAYWIFRYILMEALCYTLSQENRFSSKLVDSHRHYIHIDWGFGNKAMDALDQWLKDLISAKLNNPNDPNYYKILNNKKDGVEDSRVCDTGSNYNNPHTCGVLRDI